MGILTVVFALCHRSQQSGCKTERLSLCHPEVNDVIAKLLLVDKVYTVKNFTIKSFVGMMNPKNETQEKMHMCIAELLSS